MTIRFVKPRYPGDRHRLRCGNIIVGAVFPPVVTGDDWIWRLWASGGPVAPNGRAKTEQAAKDALLARFRDFLRTVELGGRGMTKTVCIYHGNCADGFTAAWAVWKALGDAVEFVPGVYGEAPPDVTGADVIMVDFSYKRPVLEAMATTCRSTLVLDHHKTAAADLAAFPNPDIEPGQNLWDEHLQCAYEDGYAGLPAVVFDMDRSGAQIAWDFFHPGRPRPKIVDYVADRDLWRFELGNSRNIAAWLFSLDYTFEKWSYAAEALELDDAFYRAAMAGEAIERKHHKDITELLKITRREMMIGGHRVPVANLPYTMASDAAGQMAEGAPFAACYYDRPDARVFSLRSRGDGADVAEIAAKYGGGGHRNAAGFQAPLGWEGDA